jgi:hypothetical protein
MKLGVPETGSRPKNRNVRFGSLRNKGRGDVMRRQSIKGVILQAAGADAGHWSARAASLLLACHRMCWPVNGQVGIRRFRTSAIGSASDHYVGNLARATDGDGLRPHYSANLFVQLGAATEPLNRRWYERARRSRRRNVRLRTQPPPRAPGRGRCPTSPGRPLTRRRL